jgi:ABC-type amino acid transport substrate-binding protein
MERDVLQPNAGVGMAFSSPFLYTGTLFAGPPELVECAETGETLLGVCSDLLICVVEETTTISVVQKHLDGSRILPVTDSLVLLDSLAAGNCNVLAGEPSALFEWDVRNAGYEGDYVFGSLLFSKEPLAMVTRGNDPEFADFVEWVFQALVTAEALNITQTDADLFPPTTLFGSKYSNMFSHAVAANGHYGEIYERNVEQGFPRAGMNFVTQQGDSETGLLFAIPFGNLAREDGPSVVAPDSMLHAVDDRNLVVCGVLADRPWLGIVNDVFDGIDVEFCRALSAAKFHGNTNQLAIVKYDTLEAGFEALDKKIIDVFASVPYTMENNVREASTGIGYSLSPPYFFDPSSDSAFSMATRQDDQQWSDFVRWTIFSTIYAEEQSISSDNASDLPTVDLFGPSHIQMFRFINLALGNYGDMYNRTQEARVPRAGANLLSSGGPHMIARPNDFGFE